MSLSPRKHNKLSKPRSASVSLDNLLGLLSSAYGTEELDSTIIFENDSVNWKNISVENLKAMPKKDERNLNTGRKEKAKENIKVNASTSTSSLQPGDEEVDETLFFIRSLANIHQIMSDLEIRGDGAEESTAVTTEQSDQIDFNQEERENDFDDEVENEETSPAVIGFYVDDSNHTVIFDIQFVKRTVLPNEILLGVSEPEITFNISDIPKQTKTTISVAKAILVSKVQYFANVEKEFGLENFDVIVKCKHGVFQWIVQWLKSDMAICKPTLNNTNLKSIMTLSSNLGIEELVDECLDYFKQDFKTILDSDCEMEDVLNGDLLNSFTRRFSNTEIEEIEDEYQSLKSKMFCSLIKFLGDPDPLVIQGHFFSLSTLFQCNFCEKIIHNGFKEYVPCRTDHVELNFLGELVYHHQCSPFWNMTNYIGKMYEKLKCWRKVYWRLWGMCHFSYCELCNIFHPMYQNEWCPYHPKEPEFFARDDDKSSFPVGSYGCCGETAYKFNVIKPYSGCKYRSHVPKPSDEDNSGMHELYEQHKEIISCSPPKNPIKKRFLKLVKQSDEVVVMPTEHLVERFWWEGIRLAPKEKKDYSLIPQEVLNYLRGRPQVSKPTKLPKPIVYRPQIPFGKMPLCEESFENLKQPSMEDVRHVTKKNNCKPKLLVKKVKSCSVLSNLRNKVKKKKSCIYQPTELYWAEADSTENNIDNQSDFEEIAMRKLVNMLNPRNDDVGTLVESPAGSYIRLEAEWWQRNCGSNVDKTSSTVVNRTFPQSWFRKSKLSENEKLSL